jgi:ADP-heptose:LPS heptosyltransferase
VIGVDTGLTHVAAQQSTPTVTVCRRQSVYFRPWPHCRVVRGGPCTEACSDAEAGYAYHGQVSLESFRPPRWRCPSGSPCMDRADPVDAVARLRELL